ncbi:PP2C family serine/threonine-protein phosphatase [Merismopedia glauca]|uniref:Protein phosphatase 2C domain-containing protein n=1 Tax=Merismopedia glauca CCAP 1448/3 TaxID=1296344 RepID=A0A2T1C9I2_9CYAN|nr:PP2C family serine/threonine-protein phosphatase [Merismopedia glauca]PSB04894.1 protein phosphatase 2C domain-containing protein [Merismopedia glauca CCAP 1448/3]
MAWKAVARSAIGTSHLEKGLPCQDYGSDRLFSNLLIGAVADGAGSAKYADIGAKIAVEATIAHIAKTETYLEKIGCSWQNRRSPLSESQAKRLFISSLKQVTSQLQQQATQGNYHVQELACTLIAFMATPNWVAAMQIGDGFLAMRFGWDKEYKLAFKPDKGEYINQTNFVTSANVLADMQVKVFPRRPKFLCAATDGIENVAIRLKDWYPSPGFFSVLEQYMRECDRPHEEDDYLVNLLNSKELNQRTNDDKTLLLCLYN